MQVQPIKPRATTDAVPLTWQQEWGLKYWMKWWPHWMIGFAVRLRGRLDVDIMRRSLGAVAQLHESLRTRVVTVDGTAVQEIVEPCEYRLRVIQLHAARTEDAESEARRLTCEFFSKPIDLADRMFDARLYALAESDYVLAITMHHLVVDGASAFLFFRELWNQYGSLIRGPSAAHGVRLQYADYAVWQRKQRPCWQAAHQGYWETVLAGGRCVQFPTDDGLENVAPFSFASLPIAFDQALSAALHALAKHQRTTPALVTLTAYATLVSRWAGETDLIIPFVVSGRFSSSLVNVIGNLGQFLPLRIRMTGEESFVDLLKLVSQEFLTASQHLDFGKIVAESPALIEATSFNWLPRDFAILAPPEWSSRNDCPSIETFPVDMGFMDKVRWPRDISCVLQDAPEGIRGSLLYRADRFKRRTIECFVDDLRLLLKHVVRDPAARASSWRAGNQVPEFT